jgi:hypothetical protein
LIENDAEIIVTFSIFPQTFHESALATPKALAPVVGFPTGVHLSAPRHVTIIGM